MQQIFRLFSVFARLKVTINENVSFKDHGSGIRLPDCSKLAINREKNDNDVTVWQNDVFVNFFRRCRAPLAKFSFWSNDNFPLLVFDQKSANRKYPRLSLAQYLETGKFGISYVAQLFLMKCFWTEGKIIHPPFQIRVNETFKRPTTKELM